MGLRCVIKTLDHTTLYLLVASVTARGDEVYDNLIPL